MSDDGVLRRVSWIEHFFGDGAMPPRRAMRMAFRDAMVETTMRLQRVPMLAPALKSWLRSARWEQFKSGYEGRCTRHRHELDRIATHRAPTALKVTELPARRALVVGSCLSEAWIGKFEAAQGGSPCDHVLINHISELPPSPPRPIGEYDFQVVQLALGLFMPERAYLSLQYRDIEAHRLLFEDIRQRLPHYLAAMMRWNAERGLLTFVVNFLVPQQNPMGRLMPRYDLRNPVYMVEQMNALLAGEIRRFKNAHLLDMDQIAANFGKVFLQDASVYPVGHGSVLGAFLLAGEAPHVSYPAYMYEVSSNLFTAAVWAEILAMYRTSRQVDTVKLVAVDLDNTIWHGVAAEGGDGIEDRVEGWPAGVVEALLFLKKRGVLLAIVSKNDEAWIVQMWDQLMRGRMNLDDFVARRINWRPKSENLEEIIRELNILPRSVVFVDDNPVERVGILAALPEVRVLGSDQFLTRSTLLWSPETQVADITEESGRRAEMVQAQLERESDRERMTREEFLASLGIKVRMIEIASVDHPNFGRAFELVNKTNQFNTTGERRTRADCETAFARRSVFYAFEAQDRFTKYGLVGVVIANGAAIEQFVMSCRVFGLDIELAVIAELLLCRLRAANGKVIARFVETDANFPCRDLFARCGFAAEGADWIKPRDLLIKTPAHIEFI